MIVCPFLISSRYRCQYSTYACTGYLYFSHERMLVRLRSRYSLGCDSRLTLDSHTFLAVREQ